MVEGEEALKFSRDELEQLLEGLNDELSKMGVRGEICIFGGAAMLLAWEARSLTRDVDAVMKPADLIKKAARLVARSNRLNKSVPDDWLNDGVKGFIDQPPAPDQQKLLYDFSHLRVMRPPAEYLMAMKAQSARVGAEEEDTRDLKFLMKETGITTAKEVLDRVEKYYPNRQLPPKVKFFVESVAEEL